MSGFQFFVSLLGQLGRVSSWALSVNIPGFGTMGDFLRAGICLMVCGWILQACWGMELHSSMRGDSGRGRP